MELLGYENNSIVFNHFSLSAESLYFVVNDLFFWIVVITKLIKPMLYPKADI